MHVCHSITRPYIKCIYISFICLSACTRKKTPAVPSMCRRRRGCWSTNVRFCPHQLNPTPYCGAEGRVVKRGRVGHRPDPGGRDEQTLEARGTIGSVLTEIGLSGVKERTQRRPYEPKSNQATGSASSRLEFRQRHLLCCEFRGSASSVESVRYLSGISDGMLAASPCSEPVCPELRPGAGPLVSMSCRRVVHFLVPSLQSAAVRAGWWLPPGRRGGPVVGPPPSIDTHRTLMVLYSCGGDGVKHLAHFSRGKSPRRTSTVAAQRAGTLKSTVMRSPAWTGTLRSSLVPAPPTPQKARTS